MKDYALVSVALGSILLVGILGNAACLSVSVSRNDPKSDDSKTTNVAVSVWLMPPKYVHDKLAAQILEFAEEGRIAPDFPPHLTIVGGIRCRSDDHILEIVETLKSGLKGFGKVPCLVSSVPYGSSDIWNQSLYLTVEPAAALMNLCQKARALLDMDTENWTFPAPATYPHISMYYGTENIPSRSRVKSVSPFFGYTLAIWRTDPPSLDGVPFWKEIARFDIR